MTVKAKLLVLLKADDVEVAQTDDADLWQQVLMAITGQRPLQVAAPAAPAAPPLGAVPVAGADPGQNTQDPMVRMSQAAGITVAELQGACGPTREDPFMILDAHCFEAMRRGLPSRGKRAITNIQLAGTLLGLWFYYAALGNASQAQAQSILDPLGARDGNPVRGISNAEWLQARSSGQFIINPAHISRATLITRCFCVKEWSTYLPNT